MLNQRKLATDEAIGPLGECHPLLAQLGSADGLFTLSGVTAALCLPRVESLDGLGRFLEAYRTQILLMLEWPAILRAHQHASRNETRELVSLDAEVNVHAQHADLASASRRVGRSQLERLRPLRDARVVQRYLRAVEEGRAQAWHTLVFGLTLAVYSLPVRQGLLSYAGQTLRGFIQAAARPLRLSVHECGVLMDGLNAELPGRLEAMLQAQSTPAERA